MTENTSHGVMPAMGECDDCGRDVPVEALNESGGFCVRCDPDREYPRQR